MRTAVCGYSFTPAHVAWGLPLRTITRVPRRGHRVTTFAALDAHTPA